MGTVTLYKRPTSVQILAGSAPPPPPPPPSSGATVGITRVSPAHQILHPASFFNQRIPTSTVAVDPNTPAVQAQLVKDAAGPGSLPYFGTHTYSMLTYTVPGDFPCVPVKIHAGLADGTGVPSYQKAMQDVLFSPGIPLPPEYVNQGDSDDECLIYCPDLDLAWELWRLRPLATPVDVTWTFANKPDGTADVRTFTCHYECSSLWQVTNVSTHFGRGRNNTHGATYPHAPNTDALRRIYEDTNMGVSATKISFLGSIITLEDVQLGLDDHGFVTGTGPAHVVNMSLFHPLKESTSAVKWPAKATDGWVVGSATREGDRYFLDPAVYTVAAINAMNVHPLCRLVIWMATQCGIVTMDKAGATEIDAAQEVDPYRNGTAPSAVLHGFPWGALQAIGKATTNPDGSVTYFYGSDTVPNPT